MAKLVRREFIAELFGTINGQPIVLDGGGLVDSQSGVTSGRYELRHLPEDFDPRILSACLITGYPSVCASNGEVPNPFGDHPYSYRRKISFRNGGCLSLETACSYQDNRLISRFHIDGSVGTKPLRSVEPIIEIWEPSDQATIRGAFTIAWRELSGTLLIADASTEYLIDGDVAFSQLMHRRISIKPDYRGTSLTLYQDSELLSHSRPLAG